MTSIVTSAFEIYFQIQEKESANAETTSEVTTDDESIDMDAVDKDMEEREANQAKVRFSFVKTDKHVFIENLVSLGDGT